MYVRLKKSDYDKALMVKAKIEKEYYKHYTYQELAQYAGTNVLKLQIAFKAATDKNMYEYLVDIRVEEAIKLLENTDLMIETIAYKVGWDRTNLNKHFKKIMRKSPSDWRTDQLENQGYLIENTYNS